MEELKSACRVLIVAGEASGDLHGANMIRAARLLDDGLSFFGAGGSRMAEAGCEILFPVEELEVMGIVDVVRHLPVLWGAFRRLKKLLRGPQPPDALVLVDFQEFNQLLARQARRAGVPVLFYIGPTVWAWRPGRVKKMARSVDRLAVIFPFEPDFYAKERLRVDYVGHPLLDDLTEQRPRRDILAELQLDPRQPVVGLFPGSRSSELKYNLETLLETARRVRLELPGVQFLLPVAPSIALESLRRQVAAAALPLRLVRKDIYRVARACDAVLSVSGTVTLQVALTGTPLVIVYKTAPLNYFIGRLLIKSRHIGLPNIVAGRRIVPEFVQGQATPGPLAEELLRLLRNEDYRRAMSEQLTAVRDRMGRAGCSQRVAHLLLGLLGRSSKKEQDSWNKV